MEHIYGAWAKLLGVEANTIEAIVASVGIVFSFVAVLLGPPFAWFLYKKRQFLDQITYSANLFEQIEPDNEGDGKERYRLKIRTVELLPKGDILPENWAFRWNLMRAIWRCNKDQPFIIMKPSDMDILLPAIINGFAKAFSEGALAKLAGKPTTSTNYFIAATFEKYGAVKSYKLRIMIVSKSDLQQLNSLSFAERVEVEHPHHRDRIRTLEAMANRWRSEICPGPPDGVQPVIREVEGIFPA